MRILALAFLSGAPALVYEVVWTREVQLLMGSQVEAISLVLVGYFGGLALGAWWLGERADRVRSPLALYAALELGAALLGPLSILALRRGGGWLASAAPDLVVLAACAIGVLPVTVLLGGTLPALLCASIRDREGAASGAGLLVGANTAGAVGGVALATLAIPVVGLWRASLGAATAGMILALAASLLSRRSATTPPPHSGAGAGLDSAGPGATHPQTGGWHRVSSWVLAAAAAAGVATLGFEVLVARLAALRLGSSLYAWSAVLALFLGSLAAGNAAFAQRAGSTRQPLLDLGWIEVGASAGLLIGLLVANPGLAAPAAGLSLASLTAVAIAVAPAAFLMGGAFPFFVRLALAAPPSSDRTGRLGGISTTFGAVSAANTAGGIVGALLGPFVFLPAFGQPGGVVACAALNATLGVLLLVPGARERGVASERRRGWGRVALAVALVLLAAVPLRLAGGRGGQVGSRRVIYVDHSRQATAVVVHTGASRELIVDGDPEASTGGDARRTEELLAALALALRPDARDLLEVGLGSGITLGTATRFPLSRIDCVEIADSVVRAASYFAPDNRGVADESDPRVRLVRGDARAFLAASPRSYDVVLANTLHPWSLGATGLYSREYFTRIAEALRPGGIAVQWLPLQRIGRDSLAAILRTFVAVFPQAEIWWGWENVFVVGSSASIARLLPGDVTSALSTAGVSLSELDLASAEDLLARRMAGAAELRAVLGRGEILTDDRPVLEARASIRRGGAPPADPLELVLRIARAGARADPRAGPIGLWLEGRVAEARGDEQRAERLDALLVEQGLDLARRSRLERLLRSGRRQLAAGDERAEGRALERALALAPRSPGIQFSVARHALGLGDLDAAEDALRDLLATHPRHAEAWNLLGVILRETGDMAGAREAFAHALAADPYLLQALGNAGLTAAEDGDRMEAIQMRERLRALAPLAPHPEERALREVLGDSRSPR